MFFAWGSEIKRGILEIFFCVVVVGNFFKLLFVFFFCILVEFFDGEAEKRFAQKRTPYKMYPLLKINRLFPFRLSFFHYSRTLI